MEAAAASARRRQWVGVKVGAVTHAWSMIAGELRSKLMSMLNECLFGGGGVGGGSGGGGGGCGARPNTTRPWP